MDDRGDRDDGIFTALIYEYAALRTPGYVRDRNRRSVSRARPAAQLRRSPATPGGAGFYDARPEVRKGADRFARPSRITGAIARHPRYLATSGSTLHPRSPSFLSSPHFLTLSLSLESRISTRAVHPLRSQTFAAEMRRARNCTANSDDRFDRCLYDTSRCRFEGRINPSFQAGKPREHGRIFERCRLQLRRRQLRR